MKCCNVQDKPSDHTERNGLNNPLLHPDKTRPAGIQSGGVCK